MKKKLKYIFPSIIFGLILVLMIISFIPKDKYNHDWYYNKLSLDNNISENNNILALIDSGYNSNVGFDEERIIAKYNAIDDSADVEDNMGHGTSLLSLVLGIKYQNEVVEGINPYANIIIIKAVSDSGYTTPEIVSKGIEYAIENKASIINISLGTKINNQELESSIKEAQNNGIIIVSSVGDNEDDYNTYPARYDGVIGVCAQYYDGEKYILSNKGESSVMIPGVNIKVLSYDLVLQKWLIEKNSGSSISSVIFSSILSRVYKIGSNIDYTYLLSCMDNNEFINYKKIIREG